MTRLGRMFKPGLNLFSSGYLGRSVNGLVKIYFKMR